MRYRFTLTNIKAVDDLGRQYEKIMQRTNRGSIETRYRYAAAGERFVKWVQPTFKLQKLANLRDKHLIAYGNHLKSLGKSHKYIKNELSALRYIHSITPDARYHLAPAQKINREIGLGSNKNEKKTEVDRAWTRRELNEMRTVAINNGRPEFARMMHASYTTGMRLDEAASLKKIEVRRALETGILHLLNTKGGRPRDVPLSSEARRVMEDALASAGSGRYVFCPADMKVHELKKKIEDFIHKHRDYTQDPGRAETAVNQGGSEGVRAALSYHGLRYSYAQNTYAELREEGMSDEEARQEVAERLGHGRIEITFVYV